MAKKLKTTEVYFVQATVGAQLIKIGFSGCAVTRPNQLQADSPVPLKLIGVIPGGYRVEHALHERFKTDHAYGEWFRPSPELLEYIQTNPLVKEHATPGNLRKLSKSPRGYYRVLKRNMRPLALPVEP